MSTQVKVQCPHCGKSGILRLPSPAPAKMSVKCPSCGKGFEHMGEQRNYYRRIPYPPVRYGPFDLNFRDLPYGGELMDISVSGCRVKTRVSPPQPQDELSLVFKLPDESASVTIGGRSASVDRHSEDDLPWLRDRIVRVGGKVVWHKRVGEEEFEFGVRFTYEDDETRKNIGFYLFPHHNPLKS